MSKVSIYDPFADAFRDVEIEAAKKFLESVPNVQRQIDELEPKVQPAE